MAQPILFASNIFAGYGDQIVLFDVNFEIQSSEWVLFIGPNGSGKSTFLKVVGGLITPKRGKIVFNLPEIGSKDKKKNGIGFLKQANNIFPALTVMENLELASFYSENHEFNNYLELLFATFPDLKENNNKRAGLLSGGMRQKLAIGMVLARKHKLLLLDEPTAGLAPHAASEILDKIERVKNELSKLEPLTIIMVEHNYRYVKDKVTRLVGMREGRIVIESDSPMDILDDKAQMEKIFFG